MYAGYTFMKTHCMIHLRFVYFTLYKFLPERKKERGVLKSVLKKKKKKNKIKSVLMCLEVKCTNVDHSATYFEMNDNKVN